MSKFKFNDILMSSCIALNDSRFKATAEDRKLYDEAVKIVSTIFSSLVEIQDVVEAELLYSEYGSTFSHPDDKKSFDNAIESCHYALDLLKIIKTKPQMYIKYCVPACLSVKTNDKNGVPKDAFRNALTSHKTRLRNNKQHGITDGERAILTLRLKNVATALKLYKELQKQVLGL